MIVTLHIIDKETGEYLYSDRGDPEFIIMDLSSDKDFTLTPPPDNLKSWRWVNNQWQ